jgi:uncharacterized protein YbgA (DUF1722 family)
LRVGIKENDQEENQGKIPLASSVESIVKFWLAKFNSFYLNSQTTTFVGHHLSD